MEFFLNGFAEISDKEIQQSKVVRTYNNLLHSRPKYYHTATTSQVIERIFKLTPVDVPLIFVSFAEFTEFPLSFWENSITFINDVGEQLGDKTVISRDLNRLRII